MQDYNSQQQEQVFRPLITSQDLLSLKKFRTNSNNAISVVPFSYMPFKCIDGGSASPKIVRSTFFIFPQDRLALKDTGIPLGIVLKPLFNDCQDEIIYREDDVAKTKCRCGGYFNCNSYVSEARLYCSFCKSKGFEIKQQNREVLKKGVFEISKITNENIFYYILVFEISQFTLKQRIIQTALLGIKSAIGYIHSNVRICLIGFNALTIKLYSLSESLELQVININKDFFDDEIPQLISKMSIKIQFIQIYIRQILNQIAEIKIDKSQPKEDCLGDILAMIIKSESNIYKKIMIITSHQKHKGKYDIGNRGQIYSKIIDSKSKQQIQKLKNTLYFSSDQNFRHLNELLRKYNNCTLDFFLFPEKFIDIENLKQPALRSGGSIYLYENYNYDMQSQFYYEFFRLLSRKTVFNMQLQCFTADPLEVKSIILANYEKQQRIIKLNSFNQDQTLIINLNQSEKPFLGNKSCIQFVIKYNTQTGTFIKVINFTFFKNNINHTQNILAGFDPEAASKVILANFIVERHKLKLKQEIKKCMLQKIKQFNDFLYLVKYKLDQQKKKFQKRYLESYQLYLTHMFYNIYRFPCSQFKSIMRHSYQQYSFLTLPIEVTSKIIYPRLYQIKFQYLDGQSQFDQIYETIPANFDYLQDQGIYIFDKGRKLYLCLRNLAEDLLVQLFGTADISQIEKMTYIPSISKKSQSLTNIIQYIRSENFNSCQPIEIILTECKEKEFEKQLFIENPYYVSREDDYEKFIKQYLSDI